MARIIGSIIIAIAIIISLYISWVAVMSFATLSFEYLNITSWGMLNRGAFMVTYIVITFATIATIWDN